MNAVNNAVNNGIVTTVSAGNDGAPGNNVGSPGDADNVITVAAMSNKDNITEYSSSGGNSYTGYTVKPDITAPGGSEYDFLMLSIDSGDSDADNQYTTDAFPNDLAPMKGTSMAAPAVAGASNLLIQAMGGFSNWNYTSTEAKRVKALLLMTATETYPLTREVDTGYSPSLDRGGKDIHEGYGRININTAIEAYTQKLNPGSTINGTLESSVINSFGRHAFGCYVNLNGSETYGFNLDVPNGADFDVYMYSNTPTAYGEPILLASSTSASLGGNEFLYYTPTTSGKYYIIVKAISGSGIANLTFQTNNYQPGLTGEMYAPTSANQSTLLTFNVTYTDQDNNPPLYVNLTLNGTHYQMNKQNSLDKNFTDGCVYEKSFYLQPGSYNYSMICADYKYTNSTVTHTGVTVTKTNLVLPALSSGQVNPSSGTIGTALFTFKVNYSDADNNMPIYVNLTVNSTTYSMHAQNTSDNNYMDGCWFEYEMYLDEVGNYTYYFNCSDESGDVSLGPFSGPEVNIPGLMNYDMLLGYTYQWVDATTGTRCSMAGSDDANQRFNLPFTFDFYGVSFNQIYVCTNGFASFVSRTTYSNVQFPSSAYTYMIAPFWDDLRASNPCNIFVKNLTSPNRVVIEFQNYYDLTGHLVGTFEIILYESGEIIFNYDYLSKASSYTCGLNYGVNTNYFNNFQGLSTSMNDYSIRFYKNIYPPKLQSESLSPTSGNQSTLLNFTANYSDPENIQPTSIHVSIGGVNYTMSKQNPSDTNYIDGCIYQSLIYLQPGTYSYTFVCNDGKFERSTTTYSGLSISYFNNFGPSLSSTQVSPTVGLPNTVFTFSTIYHDADNNYPSFINITINNGTQNITYSMTASNYMDTNAMDGKTYIYSATLAIGSYKFQVNCSDSENLSTSVWINGPSVTPSFGGPRNFFIEYWYIFLILGIVIGVTIPTVIIVRKRRNESMSFYTKEPKQELKTIDSYKKPTQPGEFVSFEDFIKKELAEKSGIKPKEPATPKLTEELGMPKITEEPKLSYTFDEKTLIKKEKEGPAIKKESLEGLQLPKTEEAQILPKQEEKIALPKKEPILDKEHELTHEHHEFEEPNFMCGNCNQQFLIKNTDPSLRYNCPECGKPLNRLVRCTNCSQLLALSQDDFMQVAGKQIKCPMCQGIIKVPSETE
ncbi:MAG: S8 family serine peptidase [Candidatus Helarchaeota archaeon]